MDARKNRNNEFSAMICWVCRYIHSCYNNICQTLTLKRFHDKLLKNHIPQVIFQIFLFISSSSWRYRTSRYTPRRGRNEKKNLEYYLRNMIFEEFVVKTFQSQSLANVIIARMNVSADSADHRGKFIISIFSGIHLSY
jgi:hypothetical protein